jgi:N utilization substance protein A
MNEEQSHALVYAPAEEISKVIGKQGQNIRLASWLTGYNIDVYRDKEEGDDVELVEFADEIEEWIINEFKKVGLDTARSVLDKETAALVGMTDLELETIEEVKQILRDELDD